MQPSEETVEAVARAIADVATQRPVPWETRHPLTQDALRTDARICLAALPAALPAVGLAVVGADARRAAEAVVADAAWIAYGNLLTVDADLIDALRVALSPRDGGSGGDS
jgi:hypothetical protein